MTVDAILIEHEPWCPRRDGADVVRWSGWSRHPSTLAHTWVDAAECVGCGRLGQAVTPWELARLEHGEPLTGGW